MATRVKLKPNRSFRQYAEHILPIMLAKFLSYEERILAGQQGSEMLHRMRITGKPLRYMMEASQPAFGREFDSCLHQLEHTLDLLGSIHDCDVAIPVLAGFREEVKIFNNRLRDRKNKLSMKPLAELQQLERRKRNDLLRELGATLKRWNHNNYPARLVKSMETARSRSAR